MPAAPQIILEEEPPSFTDTLRSQVLSGNFPGGTKLREVELANRFDISRTPVREALIALEREGLVTYERNRGFSVRSFTGADLYQAYELRAVLEGYAAGQLARRGLDEEKTHSLRECIWQVNQLLRRKTVSIEETQSSWKSSNLRFHTIILDTFGNAPLVRAHRAALQVPRIHDWLTQPGEDTARAMDTYNCEHAEIVDAIEERNSQRAEFIAREHVMRGCRAVAARLGLEIQARA